MNNEKEIGMAAYRRGVTQNRSNGDKHHSSPSKRNGSSFRRWTRSSRSLMIVPVLLLIFFLFYKIREVPSSRSDQHDKTSDPLIRNKPNAVADIPLLSHDPPMRKKPTAVADIPLSSHTVDDVSNRVQDDTSTVGSDVVVSTNSVQNDTSTVGSDVVVSTNSVQNTVGSDVVISTNSMQNDTSTIGSDVVVSTQSQERSSNVSSNATKIHPLTIDMHKKLNLLPSPPWPQLDKRTLQAIANGFVQGVEAGMSYNNTIVTAYYDFNSKHSTGQYLAWINNLLQTSDPMIIFVEPGSTWFDLVKERRSHAPTIIAEQHFDDLVMSSTFTESFWQYQHGIDGEAKVHKGTGVYKIWNEKMVFLHSAIKLNPFDTPGFAWMDAGYFRKNRDAPPPSTAVIKVNLTESGVPLKKVLFLHVRNDDLSKIGRVNLAGNAWYGSASAFLELYPRYYATFWDWISKGKFIGSDQFVMTETCRRYKSSCHPYYPGGWRDWFALSAAVAGKRGNISEISPHFLFLDEPPKDITAIPTGQKVTFCNETVVAVDLKNGAVEC